MSTEPVSHYFHQDLRSQKQLYTDEANSELTDLRQKSEYGSTAPIHRLSSVAIYTLAALAVQDFAHQASAASVVDSAQYPQIKEAGDLVIPAPTEEAVTQAARMEQSKSAVASPESLNVQEFAPEALRASTSPIIAPDSINTAEAAAAGDRKAAVPTPDSLAPQATRTGIAPPETEIMLARTSVQSERVMSAKELGDGKEAVGKQDSQTEEKFQQLNPHKEINLPPLSSKAQSQSLVARAEPKLSQQTQTGEIVAQAGATRFSPPVGTRQQVESLQDELRDLENVKVEGGAQASPALSINIPTAFGADNNTGFVSATYQQRTRYGNVDDGGLGIGIGLGDAQKAVGVELSYTSASFGGSRDFGAGGFNAKVHRQFPNDWAVAAGWNGFLNVGGGNDFEQSLYGVVSKVIRTREDINLPFSRVAVTAGVGNGQFRTEDAVAKGINNVNVFGNVAVRVAQPVSLIAEWSGQDLGFGMSVAPFKNIPLTITPAVRDVVGAGDGPRFVLGSGLAFKF